MARHAALHAEQFERERGLVRPHRVVVADREDGEIGLVQAPDQRHVAEDARVAGEVDALPLGADDDAARLAHVRAVVVRARVERVRQREAHVVDGDGAALVEVDDVRGDLGAEPAGKFNLREDGGAVLVRKRDGVADVVAVPVRDGDDVDAFGRLLVLRALRIAVEEWIDVDALAGRVEAEGGVSEPCEFHGAEPRTWRRTVRCPRTCGTVESRGSCPWRS